jgi:hypothetical protein
MDNKSATGRERKENSSKVNEQRGNVYENKGPLWKTGWQGGNVIENKASYALKSGNVVEKKGRRSQVVGPGWEVVGGEEQGSRW